MNQAYEDSRHRHVQLISGRAKACEIYSAALCRAILIGLVKQCEADAALDTSGMGLVHDDPEEREEIEQRATN